MKHSSPVSLNYALSIFVVTISDQLPCQGQSSLPSISAGGVVSASAFGHNRRLRQWDQPQEPPICGAAEAAVGNGGGSDRSPGCAVPLVAGAEKRKHPREGKALHGSPRY